MYLRAWSSSWCRGGACNIIGLEVGLGGGGGVLKSRCAFWSSFLKFLACFRLAVLEAVEMMGRLVTRLDSFREGLLRG
jgi:hypothetical protein